jgi:membrane-associated phospholipid phosphatase
MGFDAASMVWIRTHRRPALTAVLRAITHTGTGRAWFIGAGVVSLLHAIGIRALPAQTTFLRAALTALLAWALGSVVKRLVARPRPSHALPDYDPAVPTPACRSFPSSHAAASIAFAVALTILGHPWAMGVGAWAAVVTFSRFYLGVHYPTDLLGGAMLGALS